MLWFHIAEQYIKASFSAEVLMYIQKMEGFLYIKATCMNF